MGLVKVRVLHLLLSRSTSEIVIPCSKPVLELAVLLIQQQGGQIGGIADIKLLLCPLDDVTFFIMRLALLLRATSLEFPSTERSLILKVG